jgi:hypothetical protein
MALLDAYSGQWTTAEAASIERAVEVEPGNTSVPRGGALDVQAALVNFEAGDTQRIPCAPCHRLKQ